MYILQFIFCNFVFMKIALIILFFGTSLVHTLLYNDCRCELDEIRSAPIEVNLDSIALCYVDGVVCMATHSDTVNTTANITAIKCKQYEMALYEVKNIINKTKLSRYEKHY